MGEWVSEGVSEGVSEWGGKRGRASVRIRQRKRVDKCPKFFI